MMRNVVPPLAAFLLLAGCAGSPARERPTALVAFTPEIAVHEVWSLDTGSLAGLGDDRLGPALVDGTLYLADSRGRVLAVKADDRRRLWETDLDVPVTGATGAGEGLVVVGTLQGEVVALDAISGKRRWTARVSSEVLAPPTVGEGMVVVQTIDGKLFGLDAGDGRQRWMYERSEPALSLRGHAAPLMVRGYVLAGFASGKVVALQVRDGRLAGEFTVAQPHGRNEIERLVDVDATPLVLDNTLFAASFQGRLVAVDLGSGRLAWSRNASVWSGLAADSDHVYLSDEHGQVVAFDRSNGASLWRQERLRARVLSAPAVHDGYVVVGDLEGYLHWLGRDDGRFAGRYRLGNAPIRAPALVRDGVAYVVDLSGRLAALRIEKRR